MNLTGEGFSQQRSRHKPVHKLSPNLAACMPKDVKLDEIAVYGYNGKPNVTVAERIKELRGRCSNGLLAGPDKKEIRFFHVTCWGNPPSNYRDLMAEEQRKLEMLKAKYTVIIIRCDPGIQ